MTDSRAGCDVTEVGRWWAEIKSWRGQKVTGYIPHDALAELGIRFDPDGTTFFSKEDVERIHKHPEWDPA